MLKHYVGTAKCGFSRLQPFSLIMKNMHIPLLLSLIAALMSSCYYPYPPNANGTRGGYPDPAPGQDITSGQQSEVQDARNRIIGDEGNGNPAPDPQNPVSEPPPRQDYRVAVPIPGKEGFVFNPFTNDPVDVRAIQSGTHVRDPNDPDPDHKFRVP